MSKLKVGDKVLVKYIPGLQDYSPERLVELYPEFGEVRTITEEIDGYEGEDISFYLDEPTGFFFCEDSLELAPSSSRTQIGLETELHALKQKMQEIEAQLNSLKEEE